MLGHNPYYHRAIKSAIVAFGSIFTDLTIRRAKSDGTQTQDISVPVRYIAQDRGDARRYERAGTNTNDLKPDFRYTVPRMGFWIPDAPNFASNRNSNQLNRYQVTETDTEKTYFYRPAPFSLPFEAHIVTKHEEDMFQIIEQILPFFRPDYTVSVYTPDNQTIQVPFTLQSSSLEHDPEGSMEEEKRTITLTLNFEAIIHLYGPESTEKIIKQVDIDMEYLNLSGDNELIETISVDETDL